VVCAPVIARKENLDDTIATKNHNQRRGVRMLNTDMMRTLKKRSYMIKMRTALDSQYHCPHFNAMLMWRVRYLARCPSDKGRRKVVYTV